ncbi:hypothetical protein ACFY5F_30310 [Streptomyces sp. NPDC013161]|uniref:hypothetical protein n=1 Tax=Streptomyces sp. NPDC013161 TaxID=3364862 RepID=UPI00368B32D8
MDVIAVALVPAACLLVVACAAMRIVVVALKGSLPQDRALVLRAVAEVIRAVHGRDEDR